MEFQNGDIIITTPQQKQKILKLFQKQNILCNVRFFTLSSFFENYFGTYKKEAIYELMKTYHYKYDVAKMYLDHYPCLESLKAQLEEWNLLKRNTLFPKTIHRIFILGNFAIEPYQKKVFDQYETVIIQEEIGTLTQHVYEFETPEEELSFHLGKIKEQLKTTPIEKLYLVNVTEEYWEALQRLSYLYHIPTTLASEKEIFSLPSTQTFLKSLQETKDLQTAFQVLEKSPYASQICAICNTWAFRKLDDIIIECITEEIKKLRVKIPKKHCLTLLSLHEIEDKDGYYYIVGCNQGKFPLIHKEEDFLTAEEKKTHGHLTALEKNIWEKQHLTFLLKSYPHLTLSYKKRGPSGIDYPSTIFEELSFQILPKESPTYQDSHLYNQLSLAAMLDHYIKYNEKKEHFDLLYATYKKIPYHSYQNQYTKINNTILKKHPQENITLSYSSLDQYYRCAFRYYLSYILKIDSYEESFTAWLGTLFHKILAEKETKQENFDFEQEFQNHLKTRSLTAKESFLTMELKEHLKKILTILQEQKNYTDLKQTLVEEKISIKKNNNVTFIGILDKVNYQQIGHKTILQIVDYKTGFPNINLSYLPHGLSMQLPIYLFLAKQLPFPNIEIGGCYLQKILPHKISFDPKQDIFLEEKKQVRLEGYSTSNIDLLKHVDKTFENSQLIKGMKTSKNGFYPYTKVLSKEQIDIITNIAEEKINQASIHILNGDFEINPKRIGFDLVGCEYCHYKDICYRKEEDVVFLKEEKELSFLGGE